MASQTNQRQFIFARRPLWLPLRVFLLVFGMLFLLAPLAPLFSIGQWTSEIAKWAGTFGMLFFGTMFILAASGNGQDIYFDPATTDLVLVTRYLFLPRYTQRFATRGVAAVDYYVAEGVFRGTPRLSLPDSNGHTSHLCYVSRDEGSAIADGIATALGVPVLTHN